MPGRGTIGLPAGAVLAGHGVTVAGTGVEPGSWRMDNRHKTMNRGEFGFAVDWMRKDLGICLSEARRNGAHLPVTALVDQFYSQIQKMGGKRWDTSSLIALLER